MVDNKNTEEYLKRKVVQEIDSITIPEGLKDEIWQGIQEKRKRKFSNLLPYIAMIACLVILIPLGLNLIALSEGKTTSKSSNLEVFARIYGYVRYFHPSDEAADLDWDEFAIYGANKIKQTKNDKELLTALNELFLPIAPTMSITMEKDDNNYRAIKVPKNAVLVMWKHQLESNSFEYSSERIYSSSSKTIKLYNKSFKYGENTINKKIGNINVSVPTVLYSSSDKTLGSTPDSKKKLKKLISNIEKYVSNHDIAYDNDDVRIANVIIAWNTFEHFYPYFDELQIDWLKQLPTSLDAMKKVKTEEGTYEVMRKMMVKLGDGNLGYTMAYDTAQSLRKIPISVKLIEGKLIVTYSELNKIKPGDVLLNIDGKDALKEYNKIISETSGSRQFKELLAGKILLENQDKSEAKVTVKRNNDLIKVSTPYTYQGNKLIDYSFDQKENLVELEQGIYYLNLYNSDYQLDEDMISLLAKAKGIIADMRGVPRSNNPLTFLSHLTDHKLNSVNFLRLQPILPDHDSANEYEKVTWSLNPMTPTIKGKVVFLTDANAIGTGETTMGIVENYKLGEIVGTPTAGTNGNAAQLVMPGGMQLFWTALKVVKHDGSQHHDVGIIPTVPVSNTINGITENIDEPLEAALKLLKQP